MGPKTTPSLISKGGYQIPPPPLGGREIDTPWEIGLKMLNNHHGDGDQLNNNIKEQQLIAEKSRGNQSPEPVGGCCQYTSSLDCT